MDPAAPSVDVTRHNFEASLPAVEAALNGCTFFALDCEMTGLHQDDCHDEYLDDMQSRYAKIASNAQNFLVTQFGLSVFTHDPGALPTDGGTYVASTWNFYLFPRPAPEQAYGTTRKFTCDAGSLHFLINQGFDFNKVLADGIGYLTASQYTTAMAKVEKESVTEVRGPPIVPSRAEDVQFVANVVEQVKAWVAAGPEGPPTLALEAANNSYLRLLAYQELRRPQFGAQPEGFAGFYTTKVPNTKWPVIQLVRCATPADADALAASDKDARRAQVAAAAGFARVMHLMRACGRPAVGHNCMLDAAFTLASFADAPLPQQWGGFKALAAHWLPGGMYDTKHLARLLQVPAHLGDDTSLGGLFTALTEKGAVREAISGYVASAGLDPIFALPRVEHAAGCTKYLKLAAGQAAHEAGYDAYMTGTVFVILLSLLRAQGLHAAAAAAAAPPPKSEAAAAEEAWMDDVARQSRPAVTPAADSALPAAAAAAAAAEAAASPTSDAASAADQAGDAADPLLPARPLLGRLNLIRSNMQYAALSGPDPHMRRDNVFYATGLAYGAWRNDVVKRFAAAGLGQVRVICVGPLGFFVEVDAQLAHDVVRRMAVAKPPPGEPHLVVVSYAECAPLRFGAYPAAPDGTGGAGAQAEAVHAGAKRPRAEAEAAPSVSQKLWNSCALM